MLSPEVACPDIISGFFRNQPANFNFRGEFDTYDFRKLPEPNPMDGSRTACSVYLNTICLSLYNPEIFTNAVPLSEMIFALRVMPIMTMQYKGLLK